MKNKLLSEISFIRPILIVFLLFFHAFIIYDGGWHEVNCMRNIPLYKWLDRLSYSFMLETFVFVSGYLFSFQCLGQNRRFCLWGLIKKKFSRLIIPCWIFGVLYVIAFENSEMLGQRVVSVLSGPGHLWFLPMLFWCFIGGGILIKKKIITYKLLPLLAIMVILSYNPLPFRLNNAMEYFFFFYLGMLLYKGKNTFLNRVCLSSPKIAMLWIVFIGVVVVGLLLCDYFKQMKMESSLWGDRIFWQLLINLVQLLYSLLGVIGIYLTSLHFVQKHNISKHWVNLGEMCFGIYIFQQFVLMYLYYNTALPIIVGPYFLPIIGFCVASLFSYLLTFVVKSI